MFPNHVIGKKSNENATKLKLSALPSIHEKCFLSLIFLYFKFTNFSVTKMYFNESEKTTTDKQTNKQWQDVR